MKFEGHHADFCLEMSKMQGLPPKHFAPRGPKVERKTISYKCKLGIVTSYDNSFNQDR
jgi:hypothetical protein